MAHSGSGFGVDVGSKPKNGEARHLCVDIKALAQSFKFLYDNLDGFKIKEKVDEEGIHKYINRCALMAAGTGVAAGSGGGLTLAIGIPADLINSVIQQFKVTLAVIYHKTGRYKVTFPEFMKIVGVSLGVEVGANSLNIILTKIATEIAKRLTARSAGKLIPLVGAVVGGGVNYAFIKGLGATLLALDEKIFTSTLGPEDPRELTA